MSAAALLAGLLLAPPGIVAAQSAATPASASEAPPGQAAPTVSVDQVMKAPGSYYGQTVRIVGDVSQAVGPHAFKLQDEDLLGQEEILVVAAGPLAVAGAGPMDAGSPDGLIGRTVEIQGSINQFNAAAFEERLHLDLDDSRFADWAGRPAVLAMAVRPSPPFMIGAPAGAPWPYQSSEPAASNGAVTGFVSETIDGVDAHPTAFADQQVTLGGYVDEILGPRAFTLEDRDFLGPKRVLVVTDQPFRNGSDTPTPGDYTQVAGTVHVFNSTAFEDQLGIQLADQRFSAWEGRAAIIASRVMPANWGDNLTGSAGRGRQPGSSANAQPTAIPTAPGATPAASAGGLTVADVVQSPDDYDGETQSVVGIVDRMAAPAGFVLRDSAAGGEQLLVMSSPSLQADLAMGKQQTPALSESVQVTGEVMRFNPENIEHAIGVNLDLSQFSDWTDRPVLVATSVTPMSGS